MFTNNSKLTDGGAPCGHLDNETGLFCGRFLLDADRFCGSCGLQNLNNRPKTIPTPCPGDRKGYTGFSAEEHSQSKTQRQSTESERISHRDETGAPHRGSIEGESHRDETEGDSHRDETEGESHRDETEGESHRDETEGESHGDATEEVLYKSDMHSEDDHYQFEGKSEHSQSDGHQSPFTETSGGNIESNTPDEEEHTDTGGAVGDSRSIYDDVSAPRPVENTVLSQVPPDQEDSKESPTLPPRTSKLSLVEVPAPSKGNPSYFQRDPYESQDPTFVAEFRVAVGEAYRFNPDTDRVFLCLGTKQREMSQDKKLSKKLITFYGIAEILRYDMKKIHSIPYGYEVHRLEAGKKKVERETVKYGDKNSFRSLDIDESKVDYIDVMTQYDGLLYKSGLSSSIRRKQSTRLSNEMLQVVHSWLPQWSDLLDGGASLAEHLTTATTRLVECVHKSCVSGGSLGTNIDIIRQVISSYMVDTIQLLKTSICSNLTSTPVKPCNSQHTSLDRDNLSVPWSRDDADDDFLNAIQRSHEADDTAAIRMAVAIAMVYLLDVLEIPLDQYRHKAPLLMSALLCRQGIKTPRPDFDGIRKHFPSMYRDLILNLQNVMGRLCRADHCEPLWVLAIPLYHYMIGIDVPMDTKPLDRPWGSNGLMLIIDDFHKRGFPNMEQFEIYKKSFEPLYGQCDLLQRSLLVVLSLEKVTAETLEDFSVEDILCQIHWRIVRLHTLEEWQDTEALRLTEKTLGHLVHLLSVRIKREMQELAAHDDDVKFQKQYLHKVNGRSEICIALIHKLAEETRETSFYSNTGHTLDLMAMLRKAGQSSIDILKQQLQGVEEDSKDHINILGAIRRGEYGQQTIFDQLQSEINIMIDQVLPRRSAGEDDDMIHRKESIKVKAALLLYIHTNDGNNLMIALLRSHFRKLSSIEQITIYCNDRLNELVARQFADLIISSLLSDPKVASFTALAVQVRRQESGLSDARHANGADKATVLISSLLDQKSKQLQGQGFAAILTWPLLTEYVNLYKSGVLVSHANNTLRDMMDNLKSMLKDPADTYDVTVIRAIMEYKGLFATIMEIFFGKTQEDIMKMFSDYGDRLPKLAMQHLSKEKT